MQLPKFNYLLVAIIVALCGSSSLWAQQVPTTQKPALVSEFRKLTGADKVNSSINMTFDIGTPEILSSIVEEDKEITDAQRQELRKSLAEAIARIEKTSRDFLADKSQITELSEKVIYQIYDKAFTEDELKELIAFYRTSVGQKAAVFLPSLSSQVQQEFGEIIRAKLQELIQQRIQIEAELMKQKVRDAKMKKTSN